MTEPIYTKASHLATYYMLLSNKANAWTCMLASLAECGSIYSYLHACVCMCMLVLI